MPRDSEPKFYVYECLDSDHFLDPLRVAGLNVVRHREVLKNGVPDEEWIRAVFRAEYFALTEDVNIMRRAYQSELIMNSRMGLFIVKGSKRSEKGELVVQNKVVLLSFIKNNYRPFIATITRSGGEWAQAKRQELGTKVSRNLAWISNQVCWG